MSAEGLRVPDCRDHYEDASKAEQAEFLDALKQMRAILEPFASRFQGRPSDMATLLEVSVSLGAQELKSPLAPNDETLLRRALEWLIRSPLGRGATPFDGARADYLAALGWHIRELAPHPEVVGEAYWLANATYGVLISLLIAAAYARDENELRGFAMCTVDSIPNAYLRESLVNAERAMREEAELKGAPPPSAKVKTTKEKRPKAARGARPKRGAAA